MSGFDIDVRVERGFHGNEPFRLEARFEAPAGVTVLFGPSGAGKTTLLLAVLGALRPREGHVRVAGRDLFDSVRGRSLPVRQRNVGMVFQDALLFPHLDVLRNVTFGMQGAGRRARAIELLERVGAEGFAGRRPAGLSGGERQRVALARALAAKPAALLLDEPFSALDAGSREALGRLIAELQESCSIPFLHVTHDPGEALRVGSHLVMLDAGRVARSGTPADVITRPGSLAAARALGTENLFTGTVLRHLEQDGCTEVEIGGTRVLTGLLRDPEGARVELGLREEEILLSLEPLDRTSARNILPGTVSEMRERGPAAELLIETPAPFRVLVTPVSVRELGLEPGRQVFLLVKANAFHRLV